MATLDNIPHDALAILVRLITTAIDRGYVISVHDGEAWAVKKSTDRRAILTAIDSVEGCTLRLRRRNGVVPGELLGNIYVIPSNGEDVISDCWENAELLALVDSICE